MKYGEDREDCIWRFKAFRKQKLLLFPISLMRSYFWKKKERCRRTSCHLKWSLNWKDISKIE